MSEWDGDTGLDSNDHHDTDTTYDDGNEHGHAILAEFSDGSQSLVVDTDHDGYADIVANDADGDGNPETIFTSNYGDPNVLDTVTVDSDDDGDADAFYSD